MTNITKAAQDALEVTLYECVACKHLYQHKVSQCDCLENHDNEYREWIAHPKSTSSAALQDKAGEVRGYEPAGFLLHWPAPGGGRDILWSKDGAAGHAIGCPVTEVFKATDLASQPAPVVPDDHPLMIFARECELGTHMEHEVPLAARKAIAASQQKGGQHG